MAPSGVEPEQEPRRRMSPYGALAVEWIAVALFAGIVFAILGVAAAIVYWAWTA